MTYFGAEEKETGNELTFARERSHYRQGGMMVWAKIRIGGRTDLDIVRNGTLTAKDIQTKY